MIMFCQFYIACCRDFFIWCVNVIMMVMSQDVSYRRKNTTTPRRRMDSKMTILLKKLGYGLDICTSFERKKITPHIVCNLSMLDMRCLGISNCSDMMKLRVEC